MSEEEPTQPEVPARAAAGSTGSAARGLFRRDMERQEQLLSFAAAALAVVLGVVGALTYKAPAHNAHAAKTVSPDLLLGLACGFGVALWLAARHGSRVLTALVAMALFLTAFSGTILGFPFVGLGGWLLIKNSRAMREQRQAARDAGAGSGRSAASGRSTGAGAAGGRGSSRPARETRQARRARKDAEAEAARRIEANKRYTPPAPRRRRPAR
ncbi:MAG TPA: hypothetical protein VFH50_13550 [Acidimicrobiales bacterium]|nr:hypothetical protein [Acidimicrobiales bacterium]